MLSTAEQAKKREAALQLLKETRIASISSKNNTQPPMTTSAMPAPSSSSLLPAQSRDGTVRSRYFAPPTPAPNGSILVPNSSPHGRSPEHRPYQPYRPGQDVDVAPSVKGGLWSHISKSSTVDPMMSSTEFIGSNRSSTSSLRRSRDESDMFATDERPRKKMTTDYLYSSIPEPESPGIQRAGQRRRNLPSRDADSEESSTDQSTAAADARSRLVHAGHPVAPTGSDPFSDTVFTKLKMTNPSEPQDRVKAALLAAHHDFDKATQYLLNPNWTPPKIITTPPKPPSHVATPVVKPVGRVDGYEQITRAQREAAREKGKQSAIYAHQKPLPPPVSKTPLKPPVITFIPVDQSPIPQPSRRKRAMKQRIDSDSEFADSDDEPQRKKSREEENDDELRTFEFFNTKSAAALQELTGCTVDHASTIIGLRPFESIEDLNTKLRQGRKKAGPSGMSPRLFDDAVEIMQGYGAVDRVLQDCEETGAELRSVISSWTATSPTKGKSKEIPPSEIQDGALSLASLAPLKDQRNKEFLVSQPALIAEGIQLKDYQLMGVNWLRLLYNKNLSCILADEMGLGKTIQVISFFAHLKENGRNGPHLVVVPSSTLENWVREFDRFAPGIEVRTYYGSKNERMDLRLSLLDEQPQKGSNEGWNVLITTYNLAQGDGDRKFFRKIEWDSCVYDEGHVLKNFQSQRYQALLKVQSNWRLLLTGTPLQNNLQELVSLMNFILPEQFSESLPELRAIFKAKGDSKVALLAQERVSRAKKMMTPFVLRRRKDQVLKDLPKKTERLEWCDLTVLQKTIYRDAMKRSRKTICAQPQDGESAVNGNGNGNGNGKSKKAKAKPKDKQYAENSANVLMDLRKAASHPLLFRKLFTDDVLTGITTQLLKEPDFKRRGALFSIVKEDMQVMTDAELQLFCSTYKSTRRYLQDEECYLNSGKVQTLLRLLSEYKEQGRKVLIFSQFTQILDILKAILNQRAIRYLLLTGSTAVDVRQSLVDEFTEDDDIPVFLLSTKAGGMGINLTAASVVIMFDQDFNPHNDRQAQDRAYRIGQKRDVDVVKLISRGTIEEDMLRLGETKLALDEAVAGEEGDDAPEREMRMSLMSTLREQFEKDKSEEPEEGMDMDVDVE